jgi:hypothetical protein
MRTSADTRHSQDADTQTVAPSAWAPFRSHDFARLASAQFVSNVGSWMQTVGAQELMLSLTTSATLVALIQQSERPQPHSLSRERPPAPIEAHGRGLGSAADPAGAKRAGVSADLLERAS